MTSFTDLPDELQLEILSKIKCNQLNNVRRVCHKLKALLNDESLWKGAFFQPKQFGAIPSQRLWCSTTSLNGKMYMYGGHNVQENSNVIGEVKMDMFEFDYETRSWRELEQSLGRKTEHKCVSYDGALWFIGGYNGQDYCNTLCKFNPINRSCSIIETTGDIFSPRSALTAVIFKDKLYVFGGWNGFSKLWFNDLHELNFKTLQWKKIETKGQIPSKRTSHSAVVYKGKMYIFGGFSGDKYLNDIVEYDFETQTWTDWSPFLSGDIPQPRSRFCATVHGDSMYIVGGWDKVNFFSDFFKLDFELDTRRWTKLENKLSPVPSLSQYSMTLDKNILYLFGGYNASEKICTNKLHLSKLVEINKLESECQEPPNKKHMRTSEHAQYVMTCE